jgi:ABC-type antimicrobial peptide transport system permease subunit
VSFDGPEDVHEVVGVVQAVADPLRDDLLPAVYLPFYQRPKMLWGAGHRTMTVLLRFDGDPALIGRRVRDEVRALAPTLPITQLATMDQRLGRATLRPRLNALLVSLFGGLGLVLAAIGLFGILVYRVERGIPEIGIRMALGAGRREILGSIVARGLVLTLVGLGLGVLGALGTQRVIAGLLHGIEPLDPWAYLVTFGVLLGITLLASYLPARRAAGLDPARCLRREP